MSPVGGVGINYAIQDAIVAANRLSRLLLGGESITEHDLAVVQRERELPTRVMQAFQALAQARVSDAMARSDGRGRFVVPAFVLPLLRNRWALSVPARFIAYGLCPPQLKPGKPMRSA
jgi:2-polyprenyl-6-methoxyphenol hydroxylase-like FAD-dependent oxidoreductase